MCGGAGVGSSRFSSRFRLCCPPCTPKTRFPGRRSSPPRKRTRSSPLRPHCRALPSWVFRPRIQPKSETCAWSIEFHSQLLVWCFTKQSTWALVPRGGAFSLRLAPPEAGWFAVFILLWALEPSLESPRFQFPNPPWLVSWGLSVWRGPFICGILQLFSSTPSIGTMDVRH